LTRGSGRGTAPLDLELGALTVSQPDEGAATIMEAVTEPTALVA
jgi:hypothetical protein